MIKTLFYNFLQTKHQEENADRTDPNYPLFPQTVEIRPITPFRWEILKTLTIHEIFDEGNLQLPHKQIQDTMMRCFSENDMLRTYFQICQYDLFVKDLDTNTIHFVTLWKHPHEENFVMRESWIKEFVKRRELVAGMVVGMYWDFKNHMFCFSVLEGSQ
ncbi:PREDICTED: B3 domain-containing protein At5g26805-like [Camelina sativa]|uniref:B3 domain-containing protein At5g26805-like n=1 Tax=Camelina sativa TaxID=90675 RepID=A0ABM0T6D4_CAMSA|nr:PREDICTED: B3 domain-containing protein At5g26805-like [Camelina sativa]